MLYNKYLQALQSAHRQYLSLSPEEREKESKKMKKVQQKEIHIAARGDESEATFDFTAVPCHVRDRVMKMFGSSLGGQEYFAITGGAPTSESVKKFMSDCFGGRFSEDYGATEVNVLRIYSVHLFVLSDLMVVKSEYTGSRDKENPYPCAYF